MLLPSPFGRGARGEGAKLRAKYLLIIRRVYPAQRYIKVGSCSDPPLGEGQGERVRSLEGNIY